MKYASKQQLDKSVTRGWIHENHLRKTREVVCNNNQVSIQFLRCFVIDKENMHNKNFAKIAVYSLFPSNWPFTDKMVCVMTSSLKKLNVA